MIESIDTIKALSFTMYDKAVRSDDPSATYLGQLWDPYFGTTAASFVTQLRLKEEWDGGNYTVDSVKLIMEFSSVTGGVTGSHSISFYEIAKELHVDSTYYSNDTVILEGYKMENIPLPALKPDTINKIEIKLSDNDFGLHLLRDTAQLFHSNSESDFRSFFKGLYFKMSSTGDPAMVSLNLANQPDPDNPGYLLIDRYYKNFFVLYLKDAQGDQRTYYFIIDAINRNASFTKLSHDFNTAESGKKIENYNKLTVRDSLTYVQSLNGVYTRIVLPGLEALKNSGNYDKIAVNKARLTVPFYVDEVTYTKKNAARQLFVRYNTTTGEKPIVPDYNVDQFHSFFDGLADTTNFVYNFNLATFLQQYLEDKTGRIKPEFEIFQPGNSNMILKGNANMPSVKFDFAFTRF